MVTTVTKIHTCLFKAFTTTTKSNKFIVGLSLTAMATTIATSAKNNNNSHLSIQDIFPEKSFSLISIWIPAVNFANILRAAVTKAKKTLMTYVTIFFALLGSVYLKVARKHVGEIDSCSQFHQHFTNIL